MIPNLKLYYQDVGLVWISSWIKNLKGRLIKLETVEVCTIIFGLNKLGLLLKEL